MSINIGWGQISITPDRPAYNWGQIYSRVSQYVHDPITATALVLENGEDQVIFLSLDMVEVPSHTVQDRIRTNIAQLEGIDPAKLTMSVTHTHNSIAPHPSLLNDHALDLLGRDILPELEVPEDIIEGDELEKFLEDRLTEVITRAWESRKPGAISSATDYAAIAFNRRPMFEENGQTYSKMYGVVAQDTFKRYEAGSDHSADMIYTWDLEGNLTGVAVCIPCPSQVFELHKFITADYWGYTRDALRTKLGNIFVLSLCGAAGDQNPLDLTRISKYNKKALEEWGAQADEVLRNFDMADECRDIADRITEAVCRGYRKARNQINPNPVFKHLVNNLTLPIRTVAEEDYKQAMIDVEAIKARFTDGKRMTGADLVEAFEPLGVITRWNQQNVSKEVTFPVHAVRIGNAAIVTNPFELFIEFSLRIKGRAKSLQTVTVQLANGPDCGYLPTWAAINGGSYSAAPASTLCDPNGGDQLVETSISMIDEMWK